MIATSSLLPLAISASKKPGLARSARGRSLQPLVAHDRLVVAQAARLVEIDMRERGHLRLRFEQLVHLLLVLDQRVPISASLRTNARSADEASWYIGTGMPPWAAHRPVQPRPVVADDREVHAAPEACAASPQASARTSAATCADPALPDAQ
jgi:hypothetical protein